MTHKTKAFEGMTLEKLADMTVRGFEHMNMKIDKIEGRLESVEKGLVSLETRMDHRFDMVFKRFDNFEERVEVLETASQTS